MSAIVAPGDASRWNLNEVVDGLRSARERWREHRHRDRSDREFPSREVIRDALLHLRGALFPLRLGPADLRRGGEDFYVGHALDLALTALAGQVLLELHYRNHLGGADDTAGLREQADAIVAAFAAELPALRALLDTDVEAAYRGDPAARSVDEVLLCYPGVLALIHHRIAHPFYTLGAPLIARIIAELAHSETGIDIHPGARIGPSFFIDHGSGVVIGETAEIGERVRLYQAVTLGAKRFEKTDDGALAKGRPRHPIVEDDVVVYAGATILGRITIGRGSTIGGNVWLTHSVPPGSNITQAHTRQDTRQEQANGVAV
ncbi:serine O-acetyltransferase EpsC [Solimonas soli]|uniref:serine O-acetyltransferase EpsC n=1 Tax=Solimonas soli TaxID=413479 RepID=UPI0004809447|nr:serine O-acetyltransferase EpsC [Solimonas soli]